MTGNPCQMVTGAGAVCGFWSILNVSDTRSYFLDNGEGRKIEFSLSIKYYGPDYSGQSGGGSPIASVVKGTGAVSKSLGVSAATALSQLKQAKDMVACLPEVTDTPSLDTISSVSDAVSSIVGTVYLEKTRYRAIDALRERPLAVTDEECTLIDDLVHADYVRQAQTAFDRMSPFSFTDTPKEVQAALVSMYYQLGGRACRHAAWRFLAAGKIGKAAETLCSDRTRYKARRRDEGKLLKRIGGEQDA